MRDGAEGVRVKVLRRVVGWAERGAESTGQEERMASSPDRAAWEELSRLVHEELAAWRTAHPRAMLADIEAAVGTATRRLQARSLADLVAASPAADLAAAPPEERPCCPALQAAQTA